jgi:hypothetical protein
VATGSGQVTFARLVLAWTMTAARVDNSRQSHQASETMGQTQATATARHHRSESECGHYMSLFCTIADHNVW